MIEEFIRRLSEEQDMEQRYQILPPVPAVPQEKLRAKIVGEPIGSGSSRQVYAACKGDQVVKEMRLEFPLANFTEYYIWSSVRQTKWKGVFGEVYAISEDGKLLLMEKLVDLEDADFSRMPEFPDFIKDPKPKNFGKNAAGEIKIRDYGICNIEFALNAAGSLDALKTAFKNKPKRKP